MFLQCCCVFFFSTGHSSNTPLLRRYISTEARLESGEILSLNTFNICLQTPVVYVLPANNQVQGDCWIHP